MARGGSKKRGRRAEKQEPTNEGNDEAQSESDSTSSGSEGAGAPFKKAKNSSVAPNEVAQSPAVCLLFTRLILPGTVRCCSDVPEESSDHALRTMASSPGEEFLPGEALKVRKREWKNRTRVLVFCSRGCSFKERHLVNDLRRLMPHSKTESKMNVKLGPAAIAESAELRNCDKCIFIENRKRRDAYFWIANIAGGPTVKFHLRNLHTMGELRMVGNCLRGSRPILSFDKTFDCQPHLQLVKELITQIYGTPANHPRSQPFFDRVLNHSVTEDEKIWVRNYQIIDSATGQLEEIGPRFVLEIIKIFEGSFGGSVIYENDGFVNPNVVRRQLKAVAGLKYGNKLTAKTERLERVKNRTVLGISDNLDEVFNTVLVHDAPDSGQAAKIRTAIEKKRVKKPKKKKGTGKVLNDPVGGGEMEVV